MFGLQKSYQIEAALGHLWHELKQDVIGRAKRLEKRVENGLSNGNFKGFWDTVSVRIIGYLIVVLMAVLFAIVGYNFANDDQFHNYNRTMVERLQFEKASKDDLKCESEKIKVEITSLRTSLQSDMNEIKNMLIRAHNEDIRRGERK